MRRQLIVIAVIAALCSCYGGSPVRTPEKVKESGILRVAASNSYNKPYLYWENGQALGFEAEIARAVAAALQAEAEFIPYSDKDIETAVTSGSADVGIGGIRLGSLGKAVVETRGYIDVRTYVITRRGESYANTFVMENHDILKDKSILRGSWTLSEASAAIKMVLNGSADAFICGEHTALAAVEQNDKLQTELFKDGDDCKYAAIVSKQNRELFEFIDEETRKLQASARQRGIVYGE